MKEIQPGRYRHYKGGMYEVLGECIYTETLEEVVLYKQLHDEKPDFLRGTLWVRPKKMFLEEVEFGGNKVPRFRYLGKIESDMGKI